MKKAVEALKKRKRPLIYIGTSLLVIVLLILALNLTIRLNFLLGDELIIELTPEQRSLSLKSGQTSEVNFKFSTNNLPYCKAECSYVFRDNSRSIIIESANLTLKSKEEIERSYNLSVRRSGSGQDLYRFDVECANIRTYLCKTEGAKTFRSSLLIINYDLSDEQKSALEISKVKLESLLLGLSEIDQQLKIKSERMMALASQVQLNDIAQKKASIEEKFASLRLTLEYYRTLWGEEEYLQLDSALNGSSASVELELKEELGELDRALVQRLSLHNGSVRLFEDLLKKINQSDALFVIANASEKKQINLTLDNIQGIKREFLALEFSNYSDLNGSIASESRSYDLTLLRNKEKVRETLLSILVSASKEKDYLCALKNSSMCDVSDSIEHISLQYGSSEESLEDLPKTIDLHCEGLLEIENEFNDAREDAKRAVNESNQSLLAKEYTQNELENLQSKIRGSIDKDYGEALIELNESNFSSKVSPLLNPSEEEADYNESERLSLLLSITFLNKSSQIKKEICEQIRKDPIMLMVDNLTSISEKTDYKANSTIETKLFDNPSLCCIFGKCNPCCSGDSCRSDPLTYPIIFLHGHAFSKDTSPAYSLDAFNLIQYSLEEEGYLNAGILTPTQPSDAKEGEWGLSGKPISIKASYYQDSFTKEGEYIIVPTKSENIDTYALRLRDIIEQAKMRSGKDKVIIIAHSMGGLVARRYMQIFDDSSIDKLIMIGTPNLGLTGKVSDYCHLFGERKECEDMQQGSLFLNKLNDKTKQPKNPRLYTIEGIGCKTNEKEGDGVVVSDHVSMENAKNYNVSGTCEGLFGETLHTQMLNVNRYPRTMEILKEILKE